MDLKSLCVSLGVDIFDETETNLLNASVDKQAFKDLMAKELKTKEDLDGNPIEKLCNVAAYLLNFKKDIVEVHNKYEDASNVLHMWRTRLTMTSMPNGKVVIPILNRYKILKAKLDASQVSGD